MREEYSLVVEKLTISTANLLPEQKQKRDGLVAPLLLKTPNDTYTFLIDWEAFIFSHDIDKRKFATSQIPLFEHTRILDVKYIKPNPFKTESIDKPLPKIIFW